MEQKSSINYGQYTNAGTKYNGLNQDFSICKKITSNDKKHHCHVFVVLDGHMLLGEKAASVGGNSIVEFIAKVTYVMAQAL